MDIDGDGSFLMNVQELATAHIEKIAAKAIDLEQPAPGHGGAMGGQVLRRATAGTPTWATRTSAKQIYPDYVAIAKGFNVPGERVMYQEGPARGVAADAGFRRSRICWT